MAAELVQNALPLCIERRFDLIDDLETAVNLEQSSQEFVPGGSHAAVTVTEAVGWPVTVPPPEPAKLNDTGDPTALPLAS